MTTIRFSPWCLAASLGLLSLMHLVTILLIHARGGDPAFATPDGALGRLLLRIAIEAVLLAGGHLLIKASGRNDRAFYGLAGAVAAGSSYGLGLALGFWPKLAPDGALVTTALVPCLIGAMAGLAYRQLAGFDGATDRDAAGRPLSTFSGPVQVRTSAGAFALVALAPAIVCCLTATTVGLSQIVSMSRVANGVLAGRGTWLDLLLPFGVALSSTALAGVPIALLAGAAHGVARAFKRTDYRTYALAGFAVTLVLPVLFGGRGGVVAAIPLGAIGAGIALGYRRLAGLEPLPLPEHLLVRDRDALVGADHPSRREHRVAFES